MIDEKPVILAQYATRKSRQMAGAMNALAEIKRRRARFRAEAEERMLDEVLDRLAGAGGVADRDHGDRAGAGENREPLMPRIDPLFGLLIGVLAVGVLIAMLALLRTI